MTTEDSSAEQLGDSGEQEDEVALLLLTERPWRPSGMERLPAKDIRALYENAKSSQDASWERLHWLRGVRVGPPSRWERPPALTDDQLMTEQLMYEQRAVELSERALAAAWLLLLEPSRKKPAWLRVHDFLEGEFGLIETILLAVPKIFAWARWRWRAELWYKAVAWGFATWLKDASQDTWYASFAPAGDMFLSIGTLRLRPFREHWDPAARRLLESWLRLEGFDLSDNDIETRLSRHIYVGHRPSEEGQE
jgi:hypothetical protein